MFEDNIVERRVDKKTYRPILLWLITFPFVVLMIGTIIFGAIVLAFKLPIWGDTIWPRWVEIVLSLLSLALSVFLCWSFAGSVKGQKIVLAESEIYAPQNNWIKSESYQLEVHIPYAEIEDITFTVTTKTSENKSVWYLRLPKDWAIFKMRDGTVKRLCIGLYTRKTEIQILDDIIARCAAVGNVLDVSCGKDILKRNKKRKSSDKISKN